MASNSDLFVRVSRIFNQSHHHAHIFNLGESSLGRASVLDGDLGRTDAFRFMGWGGTLIDRSNPNPGLVYRKFRMKGRP